MWRPVYILLGFFCCVTQPLYTVFIFTFWIYITLLPLHRLPRTLKTLSVEMINTHHLTIMQYLARNPWILATTMQMKRTTSGITGPPAEQINTPRDQPKKWKKGQNLTDIHGMCLKTYDPRRAGWGLVRLNEKR